MAKEPKPAKLMRAFTLTSSIGIQMAMAVLIGYYGGKLLDVHFGTGPWLMIAGILLGVAAGTWGVVRIAEKYSKEDD